MNEGNESYHDKWHQRWMELLDNAAVGKSLDLLVDNCDKISAHTTPAPAKMST